MLTHSRATLDNINPAWSADGTQIVFERDFARTADIFAVNADGTGVHRVTHFRFSGAPFFSPDATTVVFGHDDPVTHESGIWIANADGTGDPQLVVSGSQEMAYPQFSPDGTRVTFTRYGRSGRSAIFTSNVDGSDVSRLTDWDLGAAAGSYRPDGTLLAFNSYSESSLGHSGNIYTVRTDGTELTQLTHNHDSGIDQRVRSLVVPRRHPDRVRTGGRRLRDATRWDRSHGGNERAADGSQHRLGITPLARTQGTPSEHASPDRYDAVTDPGPLNPQQRRSTKEREMRRASTSMQAGFTTSMKDLTLDANAQLGDLGACRRR